MDECAGWLVGDDLEGGVAAAPVVDDAAGAQLLQGLVDVAQCAPAGWQEAFKGSRGIPAGAVLACSVPQSSRREPAYLVVRPKLGDGLVGAVVVDAVGDADQRGPA